MRCEQGENAVLRIPTVDLCSSLCSGISISMDVHLCRNTHDPRKSYPPASFMYCI